MSHYAMLNEYRFSADVDDVRGAHLYSADKRDLGKVADVIFDHDSGDIRYLVLDLAGGRKILVPSSHVYRSVVDENSFDTDISSAEIDRLPRFDEKMLEDDKKWRAHEEEHRHAWKDQEKQLADEYKRKWAESPVQHRPGSERNITPDEEPAPAAGEPGERVVTAAELFPHRMADKFSGAGRPMTVPGNPDANEITLKPAGAGEEQLFFGGGPRSMRWHGFQEGIRRNLPAIRLACTTCCARGDERVA